METKKWCYRRHNRNTIFIYKVGHLNPIFQFKSESGLWPFKGHGKKFFSKAQMMLYVVQHGNHFIKRMQDDEISTG